MRSTAIQYLGIDVHQATLVCVVKDESGATICESKVATKRDAIEQFVRGLKGRVHIAFEEGTQAQWLYELLCPIAERVIVCDPRKIIIKGKKDDRTDAERIADLLRLDALTAVFHSRGDRRLKVLVRCYEALVDDTTRVMLRIRAIYRSRAIPAQSRSVYSVFRREEWLEQIADAGGRFRADQLYEQLDHLVQLRRRARASLIKYARADRAYRVLRSVPGIGPLRAAEIIATIGDPRRFRTKRQLWHYAGLAVVTRSSGDWVSDASSGRFVRSSRRPLTRGLNQNFNRLLKKIFKMAARDVSINAGELQQWHRAVLARGTRPEMARLTLARKLAAIVLAVWKKGVRFDSRLITQST